MQRREFVKVIGATAALIAVGDGAWYAFADGQLHAHESGPYSAWIDWNANSEPRPLNLVRAALLAASPHNTQPWRFRVGDTFIELYLETARSVRGLDPYLREAHIGVGCALENLLLAAIANGYATKINIAEGELSSDPQNSTLRLVTRIDLTAGSRQQNELYSAIPDRHTNRSPYDATRSLPSHFAEELIEVCRLDDDVRVFLFDTFAQRDELVRISAAANFELYADATVERGSEEWIRWRSRDVQKFEDGLTIDCFGLSPLATAIAKLAPVAMLKRAASTEHHRSLYAKQMQSANLIGILAVRDRLNSRQSLLAGRVWQRAHLLATARGVGARPCNEAVEMVDHERFLGHAPQRQSQLSTVIGDPLWQPTFLFLMGYPTQKAHPSPRRAAELTQIS
jgi:nitroreductase